MGAFLFQKISISNELGNSLYLSYVSTTFDKWRWCPGNVMRLLIKSISNGCIECIELLTNSYNINVIDSMNEKGQFPIQIAKQ